MTFKDVKKFVDEHIEMIILGPTAHREALEKATKFLVVRAILSEYKFNLEKRLSQAGTVREASYAQVFSESDAKNVTEKKLVAEASPFYSEKREAAEEIASEISWVKAQMEIFNDAHIVYRSMARET